MSKSITFQTSRVVPDDVYALTGKSHYQIDLTGFEAGLKDLTIDSFKEMIFTAGQSYVSDVTTPVLNVSTSPHSISWQMRELAAGMTAADIWFKLSDSEPVVLSWSLRIEA